MPSIPTTAMPLFARSDRGCARFTSPDVHKVDAFVNTSLAPESESDEIVIDFVHLARQTAGDQELELELLDLFVRRSAELLDRMARTTAVASRLDMAHGLK